MFRMPVFCLLFFLWCGIIAPVGSRVISKRSAETVTEKLIRNPRDYYYSSLSAAQRSLNTTSRAGYTLDECDTAADCNEERQCFNLASGEVQICSGEDSCVCAPADGILVACTDSSTCDEDETCAELSTASFPSCISTEAVGKRGLRVVFGPPGDGYTLDMCSDSSDCKDTRKCVLAEDTVEPCQDRDPCVCVPPELPDCCVDECISEELCAENIEVEGPPVCVSPLALERREDFKLFDCNPCGCISAHLLEHISEFDLVFKKHMWAKVLCDSQMSCATPGHVVLFKDRAMMMRSYCKIVGCNERVMRVNSPRYRVKQPLPSMTDRLEFTVFAARYETILEQSVIALAIKMGL